MFTKLILTDRIALFWLVLIFAGFFILGGAQSFHDHPDANIVVMEYIIGYFALLPWLVLRALDLLITGRVRLTAKPLRPRRPDIAVMPPHQAHRLAPRDIELTTRALSNLRE
jgi:hypothetical protein